MSLLKRQRCIELNHGRGHSIQILAALKMKIDFDPLKEQAIERRVWQILQAEFDNFSKNLQNMSVKLKIPDSVYPPFLLVLSHQSTKNRFCNVV